MGVGFTIRKYIVPVLVLKLYEMNRVSAVAVRPLFPPKLSV